MCYFEKVQRCLCFQAMLDRGLRVLLPNQARREVNLPPDFFNLTPEELKREQQARYCIASNR